MRQHFLLVPGFGAFDALASLRYYEGVTPLLRGDGAPAELASVHYFPNLPTSAIETRAEALGWWIAKRVERGTIRRGDRLHLVGHSTGGLDIRQLLYRLSAPELLWPTRDSPLPALREQLLDLVWTVQCLSTPHRGTNIAPRLLAGSRVARLGLSLLTQGIDGAGTTGTGLIGSGLRTLRQREATPDWADALLDTLAHLRPEEPQPFSHSQARRDYHELMRWLDDTRADPRALSDLRPLAPDEQPTEHTPARWDEPTRAAEQERLSAARIRCRSVVTVSPEPRERSLYGWLYRVVAREPQGVGPAVTLPELLGEGSRRLTPEHNDGIVNSVSMVWPPAERNEVIEADHGDITGHYERAAEQPGVYDVLRSHASFDEAAFRAVWTSVRDFAL